MKNNDTIPRVFGPAESTYDYLDVDVEEEDSGYEIVKNPKKNGKKKVR